MILFFSAGKGLKEIHIFVLICIENSIRLEKRFCFIEPIVCRFKQKKNNIFFLLFLQNTYKYTNIHTMCVLYTYTYT